MIEDGCDTLSVGASCEFKTVCVCVCVCVSLCVCVCVCVCCLSPTCSTDRCDERDTDTRPLAPRCILLLPCPSSSSSSSPSSSTFTAETPLALTCAARVQVRPAQRAQRAQRAQEDQMNLTPSCLPTASCSPRPQSICFLLSAYQRVVC